MDFRFGEEQAMLRDAARALLARECPPAHVKEVERDGGVDAALWRRAGALGYAECLCDPAATVEAAILLQELGRAAAPVPAVSTALVARALLRGASTAARERWLGSLRSGASWGALAVAEADGRFDAAGVRARTEARGDGFRLHGDKAYVADAVGAGVLLVAAHVGDPGADPGATLALFAVDADAEGVERRPMDTGPGIPLATCALEGVGVGTAMMVAGPGEGAAALREVAVDAAVLGSAVMLGHAAAACDASVAYARQREQFGVPIGAFQAVQHRLADMATDVETMRVLVEAAAWKRAHDEPDAELAALTARGWAAEALERVVAGAHQVHAGIGYTDDHDIQLHTRRAPWYAALMGDTRSQYARAATLLGL